MNSFYKGKNVYRKGNNMSIKCAFVSLGCPKNLLDSEVMLSMLLKENIEIVEEDIHADVVVINTCAFIESAKQEAIDTILDVAWLRENRHLRGIVVTGCLAQRYKEEIFDLMPEVDAIIGVGDIEKIAQAVKYAYENGGKREKAKYSKEISKKSWVADKRASFLTRKEALFMFHVKHF